LPEGEPKPTEGSDLVTACIAPIQVHVKLVAKGHGNFAIDITR